MNTNSGEVFGWESSSSEGYPIQILVKLPDVEESTYPCLAKMAFDILTVLEASVGVKECLVSSATLWRRGE
jgi:hypothetical protein